MREDMFKVIVERPRLIHGNWLGGGREPGFRQRMAREDMPAKVGMRASHDSRKWLNENLTPLRRFLEKQVGRPWNKVHAELLQGIDQRNTVQQHILTHVEDYVLLHVRAEPRIDKRGRQRGTRFRALMGWRGWKLVEESGRPLFVDPRTGLLRATGSSEHLREHRRSTALAKSAAELAVRRVLGADVELRCENGVWYEVKTAETPGPYIGEWRYNRMSATEKAALPRSYDVLRKLEVTRSESETYVTAKRQLNHRELVRHGIA